MYGKVVNGALWYAPRKIRLNDYTVFTNDVPAELLVEDNYKPIIESKPETPAEDPLSTLLSLIYPVGAVYQNTTNVNPGTFMTGTT